MKKLLTLILLFTLTSLSFTSLSQEYEYDIIAYRSDSTKIDLVFMTTNDSVWTTRNGIALVNIHNEVISFIFPWNEYYDFNAIKFERNVLYGITAMVTDTDANVKEIDIIEYDEYTFFTVLIGQNYVTFITKLTNIKKRDN